MLPLALHTRGRDGKWLTRLCGEKEDKGSRVVWCGQHSTHTWVAWIAAGCVPSAGTALLGWLMGGDSTRLLGGLPGHFYYEQYMCTYQSSGTPPNTNPPNTPICGGTDASCIIGIPIS